MSRITEPLTWDEICLRYPDSWVCVVDIERGELPFRTARVVGAGAARRDPLEQSAFWRDVYREIGHYSTGEPVTAVPRFECERVVIVP